jgi:ABC-2 type transport system ATP-binding protein
MTIEINHLTKRYGNVLAVSDLTLQIAQGEFFGFLGPNGAGKTTTIKILAGLLKPTSGTVRIAGFDIQHQPLEAKRMIGFIPDRPFIYPKLTGREFLKFVAGLYELECVIALKRIERLLDMFELTDWGDELIESYSHGMKQKLVMSSALLHQPKVLIVDEPMVGLDPKGARLVKEIFKRVSQEGTTIFMSTHSLEVAEQMCHRIGIILRGNLIAQGTMSELQQMAKTSLTRLEDIFLELTGGSEMQEIAAF